MTLPRRRPWRLAVVAVVALAALLAAACASKGPVKRQEVVFWIAWPVEAIEPLARRFEAENRDIAVRLVRLPWDSLHDSLSAALESGSPPDLCQLHSTELSPFMSGSSLSDWSAGVADLRAGLRGWPMVMVGDAIYGMPWLLRTQVLFWNRELFQRAGLDPVRGPATWDELRTYAAAIQKLRGGVHGYGIAVSDSGAAFRDVMPFVWSNGGGLVSAMSDSSRVAAPGTVEALEFLQSLKPFTLLASDDSLAHEFTSGRLGMLLAGSELALRLARSAPRLAHGLDLVPQPASDRGTRTSLAAGEVLVSFTGSRRKEDALKLARFLVRDENAHALATALQSLQPPNRSADTTAWYRARPEQRVMLRQLDQANYLPNHRDWPAMHRELGLEFGAVLAGRRSARLALAVADTFVSAHLAAR
jgi:ABC-type glycerol-3-phosphate transport system substrate-binding protein